MAGETEESDQLVEIAAGRGVEEAGAVDPFQLAREDGVLAAQALGEEPGDAPRVAVGEQRIQAGRAAVVVVDEEGGAEVGPHRVGGRRAVGARLPLDDVLGGESEVAVGPEAVEGAARLAEDLEGALDHRPRRREEIGGVLGNEGELLPDDPAGHRGQEVVDELRVGLGGVGHRAASREKGTTRSTGLAMPSKRTVSSMRTVSRGGWCSGRTEDWRTFSIRGSARRASRT